jgi:FMN phosphatase YigB (HAD superfamily)
MTPKAVLFDIGNVLVTWDFGRTFQNIIARSPRSLEEIRNWLIAQSEAGLESGAVSTKDFVRGAVDFIGGGLSRGEFVAAFTEIFDLIEPTWELVERVRRRVPVYLFSNTSELHETYLFRRFPGFHQFNGGFYSWRLGAMKPSPGMYEAALTTLGLRGEEIAYVDDLPANIATGRSFGFRALQYDRSRHHELEHFLEACGL